jgi:xanthine dehydrogenase small subunit
VDGLPRVACVTPVRRIAGRTVTTLEGMPVPARDRWSDAFVAAGASQCGFCTPGIVMRLAALEDAAGRESPTRADIDSALRAHLCRCTGWQTIVEAACAALGVAEAGPDRAWTATAAGRDPLLAAWRAELEGGTLQSSGADVVLGGGGFADDGAPVDALVQLGADTMPAEGIRAARAEEGRVQGRNSTVPLSHPVGLPEGDWALTLQTTWVEPAYVEPDASWSGPGGPPASALANGGAFGGKRHSPVGDLAQAGADESDCVVRVLWRREDVVRRGPKRPPLALGLRADGSGVLRVARTPGSAEMATLADTLRAVAPDVEVEMVDVPGPPVSPDLRAAAVAELLAARAALLSTAGDGGRAMAGGAGRARVDIPGAGSAEVTLDLDLDEGARGRLHVDVRAGAVLDPVTLRSYVLGAVHQGLGMVWSEGVAVDGSGAPLDLTIRSFGILAARDMPEVTVDLHEGEEDGWPVNGSDAVFAATLAAAWLAEGRPPRWPTRRAAVRSPRRDVAASERREEAP